MSNLSKKIKRYCFDFKGRATRIEYGLSILAHFCIIAVVVFGSLSFTDLGNAQLIVSTAILLLIISFISVTVRRLHDVNQSGYWVLLLILPIIGLNTSEPSYVWGIVLLFTLCILPSYNYANRFGPAPKEKSIESYFFKSIKACFDFKGRARRRESLGYIFICILLYIFILIVREYLRYNSLVSNIDIIMFYHPYLFMLPMLIPFISLTVRRLHDVNLSGYWCPLFILSPIGLTLIGLYPLGIIPLAILCVYDSYKGTNRFGPNPKQPESIDSNCFDPDPKEKCIESYFFKSIKDSFNFKGRARRGEYWGYIFIYTLLYIIILSVREHFRYNSSLNADIKFIMFYHPYLFMLPMLIPFISLTARRLHDVNLSGYWCPIFILTHIGLALMGLYPLGVIPLVILCACDSYQGTNRFGPNPKGIEKE